MFITEHKFLPIPPGEWTEEQTEKFRLEMDKLSKLSKPGKLNKLHPSEKINLTPFGSKIGIFTGEFTVTSTDRQTHVESSPTSGAVKVTVKSTKEGERLSKESIEAYMSGNDDGSVSVIVNPKVPDTLKVDASAD